MDFLKDFFLTVCVRDFALTLLVSLGLGAACAQLDGVQLLGLPSQRSSAQLSLCAIDLMRTALERSYGQSCCRVSMN